MAEPSARAGPVTGPIRLPIEALPDATLIVDAGGLIREANEKACALFGLPHASLTGSKVERLIPARFARDHVQQRERYVAAPWSRPIGSDLELFGLRADGSELPLDIALCPLAVDGESMVIVSIRDQSHTLHFRAGIKRVRYSSQVVKLGELALRSRNIDELLEQVPAFIVEALWSDVVVVFWSVHGNELRPRVIHGIPDELLDDPDIRLALRLDGSGIADHDWPRIVNDHRSEAAIDAALARALHLASSVRVPLAGKTGLLGLLATYSRQAGRFGEEEMNFLQAIGNVVIEVHLRAETEAQLAHAQRLESIGQLTGGIAHDFNNILTVVLGNLQMLREALAHNGGGYVKAVESAQRAAKRGAELTRKLLTFSRKQSLAPSAVEPAATLKALAEMLQRTLGSAIGIEWHVAPDCPPCLVDATQLDNAIVNLALNARDAMRDGGHLRISAAPLTIRGTEPEFAGELAPGDYVMIDVADTGEGMSPEVLRRACEPFFTTKVSGAGSGLGLSMVHGFVMQSGGTMRILSEPGHGTEVRLYFPAAERRSHAASARRGLHDPGPEARMKAETILVVDDDPEVLDLAEVMLARSGYRILRAADAAGALYWLRSAESIALLFTDVVLGGGESGTKLAAEAHKLRPTLPVLYASGFVSDASDVADVRPLQFLAKPYEHSELIARIETLLAESVSSPRKMTAPDS